MKNINPQWFTKLFSVSRMSNSRDNVSQFDCSEEKSLFKEFLRKIIDLPWAYLQCQWQNDDWYVILVSNGCHCSQNKYQASNKATRREEVYIWGTLNLIFSEWIFQWIGRCQSCAGAQAEQSCDFSEKSLDFPQKLQVFCIASYWKHFHHSLKLTLTFKNVFQCKNNCVC